MGLQDHPCRLDEERRRLLQRIIACVAQWRCEIGRAALAPNVMAAIARVPRESFVPPSRRARAYLDEPLDIGCGQRISAPSIVAVMTDLLDLEPHHRVLEVGTGCGYQTAVLSQLAGQVLSVELEEELALGAVVRLARLGCANVAVRVGDGSEGWPKHAPFDRILVTAAGRDVPEALLDQLRRGGRMVLPLGERSDQRLVVVDKLPSGHVRRRDLLPVRFVPLRSEPMIVLEG